MYVLSANACFPDVPALCKHPLAESTGFLKASASRTPLLSATTCIRKCLLAACSCFAKASVLRTLLLFVRPLSKSRKLLPSVKCSCFAQALALRKHLLCASTYCQNAHVFGTPLLCASIRFPQALAFRMEQQLFIQNEILRRRRAIEQGDLLPFWRGTSPPLCGGPPPFTRDLLLLFIPPGRCHKTGEEGRKS